MKHFILTCLVLIPVVATAQSESDALAFVQKHHPAIHQKIVLLKTSDTAAYENALGDAVKAAADYARIEAAGDQPAMTAYLKMYAADFAAITLSDEYLAATDPAQQAGIKAKLRETIAESFQQWLIVERARIRRLEAEIARAKQAVEAAAADPEKIVTEDTDALIEESRQYHANKNKGTK